MAGLNCGKLWFPAPRQLKVSLKQFLLHSPWRWTLLLPLLLVMVFWGGQQILSPEARHRFIRPTGDVVLLGIDPIGANADVVAAIRLQHSQTRITQIPRDTFTHSEALGSWKIGELYSLAGAEAVQEQVATLVGADFPYLVVVHEGVVAALVDVLDGLTVTVPMRMIYRDQSQGLLIDLQPGQQRLSGQQVENFIRWRGFDGDLGRLERRQEVISALSAAFQNPVTWARLPMLRQVLDDEVKAGRLATNLDLQAIPAMVRSLASREAIIEILPGREDHYKGLSYWFAEEGDVPPEPAALPQQTTVPVSPEPAIPPQQSISFPEFVPPPPQDTLPLGIAPPPEVPPPIQPM